MVLCYDEMGTLEWERRVDLGGFELPASLGVAAEGHVLLAVHALGAGYAVSRYGPDCTPLWSAYEEGATLQDVVFDVAGNTYLATAEGGRDGATNGAVRRLGPDGQELWAAPTGAPRPSPNGSPSRPARRPSTRPA